MSDDQQEKSSCISCGRELSSGAVKCAECGSFQNWRRYLQFSTTILSLVVALISVSGLVIPPLIETFQKETSRVMVTFRSATMTRVIKILPMGRRDGRPIELEQGKISLRILVTNTGQKSGFLDSAMLIFELAGGEDLQVVLTINPSEAVVKSGMFAVIDISGSLTERSYRVLGELIDEMRPGMRSVPGEEESGLLILKIVQHDLHERMVKIAIPAGAWRFEPDEIG